jgi:hypothetical protein
MLVRGASQGAAFNLATDTWRELPSFSVSPNALTIAWDGRRLITYDYELKAGAYDPTTDRWTQLPDLPLQFGECYPESTVLDDGRAILKGSVPIEFRTTERTLVLSMPGQPQRQFKVRLAANPSRSAEFSPWHLVDFVAGANGDRERPTRDDNFAIRYRVI